MRTINQIYIHSSATKPSHHITAETVKRWHVEQGWSDIGYHWFIRRCGMVEQGRDESKVGAHVKNKNAKSIGICLAGGVNEQGKAEANFTFKQYLALAALAEYLRDKYPDAEVLGHRDGADGTECPSFDVKAFFN